MVIQLRKFGATDLPRSIIIGPEVPAWARDLFTAVDQDFKEILFRIQQQIDEVAVPFVSVTDFGARGIGAGFVDTEKIQAALDASLYVFFPEPEGYWNIDDTLTFREGHTIIGTSMWDCEIRADMAQAMFKSATPASPLNGVRILGLHMNNTDPATVGGIGVDGTNVDALTIRECRMRNVETALVADGDTELVWSVITDFGTAVEHSDGTLRVVGGRWSNTPTSGTGVAQGAAAGGVVLVGVETSGLSADVDDTAGPTDTVLRIQPDGRVLMPEGADTDPVISFLEDATVGLYHYMTGGGDSGVGIEGDVQHGPSTAKVGMFGATPVVRPAAYTQSYGSTSRTLAGYTPDDESGAYSGIDNAQPGSVYATVADLNALRAAYENARGALESAMQVLNQVIDDFQLRGDLQ